MIDLPPPLLTEAMARLLSVLVPGVLGLPDVATVGDVGATLDSVRAVGVRLLRRGDLAGQALVDASAALLLCVEEGERLEYVALALDAVVAWVRATTRDGVG